MTGGPTSEDGPTGRPFVLVTVGSDHHPFDRLVRWVDEWLADGAGDAVDCLVQFGTAEPPAKARGVPYLPHHELQRLMATATVVLTQGGPLSIVEARRAGRRPVVVARTAALGEVVDDHQHTFCERLADQGAIVLARSADELAAALDAALADPAAMAVAADPEHDAAVAEVVAQVGRAMDAVLAQRNGARPTVIMLGGFGRSGSTLLERLLGETPGVVALGETLHLWERGLRDDESCGCGAPFSECPFWTRVGEDAFGGWSTIDAQESVEDRRDVVRNRHLGALVGTFPRAGQRLRRNRVVRRVHAMYRTAAGTGPARIVVDSSKHPAYAFLLRRAAVDLRCVLVVRDPRGVAYSWSKSVTRPEVVGRVEEMPTYGPLAASLHWSLYSALFHVLARLGVPLLVVRYEDLVADPAGSVGSVLAFAGRPEHEPLAHIDGRTVRLSVHHTVAGNPMRFRTGEVRLRLDTDWRQDMDRGARRIVTVTTAPFRRRYGYRD